MKFIFFIFISFVCVSFTLTLTFERTMAQEKNSNNMDFAHYENKSKSSQSILDSPEFRALSFKEQIRVIFVIHRIWESHYKTNRKGASFN